MPQNKEKYFYLNLVGIEKDSWTLERFLQDAKQHGMLDLLPKFLIQRLTDYYQLMDRLALKPETQGSSSAAAASLSEASSLETAVEQNVSSVSTRRKKKADAGIVQTASTSEVATVDDSADYWGML